MELKYLILLVSIIGVGKTIAFEFQNLQMVDYDEQCPAYYGAIDLNGFKKIGNKYYWIESNTKTTWWDAYFACREKHSNLATISTLQEMENLSPLLLELNSKGWYWVGGTDMHIEGAFRWLSNGENIPRGNMWTNGQPDNAGRNENCVHLWRDGQSNMFRLNDWICTQSAFYICERDTPKAITFVAW